MSGLRAGVVVFVGVGISNLASYVFHLISARSLGPSSYGDVATLAAVTGIVSLPLAGAQVFVARHVATTTADGRSLNDGEYVSGFAGAVLATGAVVTLALLALSPLLRSALSIGSESAVIFTVLVTAPAFLTPVLLGAIQGQRRFVLFAIALAAPSVLRVGLVGLALAAGLGVAGAMPALATLGATVFRDAASARGPAPQPRTVRRLASEVVAA